MRKLSGGAIAAIAVSVIAVVAAAVAVGVYFWTPPGRRLDNATRHTGPPGRSDDPKTPAHEIPVENVEKQQLDDVPGFDHDFNMSGVSCHQPGNIPTSDA